jgi:hypothetical protein
MQELQHYTAVHIVLQLEWKQFLFKCKASSVSNPPAVTMPWQWMRLSLKCSWLTGKKVILSPGKLAMFGKNSVPAQG